MKVKIRKQHISVVNVPAGFIAMHMIDAGATFIKVYLYGLYCLTTGVDFDNEYIASRLDILESDVMRAWQFWEKRGVVDIEQTDEWLVTFLSLDINSPDLKDRLQTDDFDSSNMTGSQISHIYNDNPELQQASEMIALLTGKALTTEDMMIIYYIYQELKLPIEVIVRLVEHLLESGQMNMQICKKYAAKWCDMGVDTIEKVEQHLSLIDKRNLISNRYITLLGLKTKELSDAEYGHILKWTEEQGYTDEQISMAFQITRDRTGSASFPYVAKVLASGAQNAGAPSPTAQKTVERKGYRTKKTTTASNSRYDISDMEKEMLERRRSALEDL